VKGGKKVMQNKSEASFGSKQIALTVSLGLASLFIVWTKTLYAQTSPWEQAVNLLQVSFTGPLARGLSLVAIVIGGIMFAYSEGGSKRTFAGIIFGLGMALGAVNFMSWLFGVA
jgi:type IV secretion system protein TrbC